MAKWKLFNLRRRHQRKGYDGAGSVKKEEEALSRENGSHSPSSGIRLEELMDRLQALVGLEQVKSLVREMEAYIQVQRLRARYGLKADELVLHMVFKGNPGTGKTTVARLLGQIFKEIGVLEKGHVVEVERADLVGEYIGHTARKTRDRVEKAIGGILFIDEAYSLARGGEKDFGREAIDTLVKAMEDHKNEFILILAGYRGEMEYFIKQNPGMRSRFPIQLTFPDFTAGELIDIARLMVKERDYRLSAGAESALAKFLHWARARDTTNFSNARLVRNLLEAAIRQQALRVYRTNKRDKQELMTILRQDLGLDDAGYYESLMRWSD